MLLNVYDVAEQGDSKGTVVRLNNLVGPKGLGLGGEQQLQGTAAAQRSPQNPNPGLPWTRRPLRVAAGLCVFLHAHASCRRLPWCHCAGQCGVLLWLL